MSFAENLVYLRQHYGVTQEGLAEQLGVSRQTVSKWEAGTNYPEMDKLLALCDLFHVSMDDLMRGSVHIAKENDTERYDRHMNRYSASVAIGVACAIFSVSAQQVLEALGTPENLQAAALMLCVVAAVTLGIVAGLSHSEFKRRNPAIEPRYSAEVLNRFGSRYPALIAVGVALIFAGVILLVALTPENSASSADEMLESLVTAAFLLMIATAAGIITWTCMQKSKYDLSEFTYIAHRQDLGAEVPPTVATKTPRAVRAESVMGALCGVIMLLALIVFLVWGIVPLSDQMAAGGGFDKWELKDAIRSGQGGFAVSWIAFVVGGILCGIVCIVGSVLTKSKEDWVAEARKEDAWLKYACEDADANDPWVRDAEERKAGPDARPRR
ncbi:XRE family transcriptional regulator [Rubneribacter badeniensis]|uniref:XRE family transcriptional regulator n=1 Tax=Rubneribacter badeniensis TaxID=2070688 RepID=A0A2K2U6P0_9ACTN|nr:helix-turn-helix transcriptional regulator [Rubneribacter badeniensis]PNV65878.1 XRE family transcriptional regulator [Rubneribacter badeniensis]